MSEDLVNLAQRWPERAATHYDGCEADHVGCLVKKLAREVERLTRERDEAQAEVERLTAERDTAQANVKWLIDRGNGKASLNRSRATDEDIWREAFMRHLFHAADGRAPEYTDHDVEKLMDAADLAMALYRKRWPR